MSTEVFYVGEVRIEPTESGGYWVYPRYGRGRYYAKDSPLANRIETGQKLGNLEEQHRQFKEGHHEAIYYYRDAEGNVGIPPEPGLPLPEGCIGYEATSLSEVRGLQRELLADQDKRFKDEGAFNEMMESVLGSPRDALVAQMMNPKSDMEREVIRGLLDVLDQESYDRRRIKSDTYFHAMEYDRGH